MKDSNMGGVGYQALYLAHRMRADARGVLTAKIEVERERSAAMAVQELPTGTNKAIAEIEPARRGRRSWFRSRTTQRVRREEALLCSVANRREKGDCDYAINSGNDQGAPEEALEPSAEPRPAAIRYGMAKISLHFERDYVQIGRIIKKLADDSGGVKHRSRNPAFALKYRGRIS